VRAEVRQFNLEGVGPFMELTIHDGDTTMAGLETWGTGASAFTGLLGRTNIAYCIMQ